jgi:hypothetical protein
LWIRQWNVLVSWKLCVSRLVWCHLASEGTRCFTDFITAIGHKTLVDSCLICPEKKKASAKTGTDVLHRNVV